MTEDHHNIASITRHALVSHFLGAGWRVTSAASDHLILKASNRWQMTAWFGNGMVGLIELYDAQSGNEIRLQPDSTLGTPGDVMGFLRAAIVDRESDSCGDNPQN